MPRPLGLTLVAVASVAASAPPAAASNSRTDCVHRLKLLGVALEAYREAHGRPPDDVRDAAGNPILSWRVRLLPYVDEDPLYREFRLDEPWDGPHNRRLLARIPDVYECRTWDRIPGRTRFLAVTDGPGGVRDAPAAGPPAVVVAEVGVTSAVEWTRPADLRVDPAAPAAWVDARYPPSPFLRRGSLALFADGRVRVVPPDADPGLLRAVLAPDPAAPARLSLPWADALTDPAVRGLLLPPVAFSVLAVGCGAAAAARLRSGRPTPPGEQLWVVLGAAALAHLAGAAVAYRYEPLPAFRADQTVVLWLPPAVAATLAAAGLAAANRRHGPWGWAFAAAAALLGLAALDAAGPHQHRRDEEAFVAALRPFTLAAVAALVGVVAAGGGGTAWAGRRWRHWAGVAACLLPLVWFLSWTGGGAVWPRAWFVRIID